MRKLRFYHLLGVALVLDRLQTAGVPLIQPNRKRRQKQVRN